MTVRKNLEYQAELTANEKLTERYVRLTFRCPAIAQNCRAGQFVNLRCDEYLRRPLAVATCQGDSFTVGIELKGKGTRQLAALKAGREVSVLGPLGNGFTLDGAPQLIMAGGGTGIFPLQRSLQSARETGVKTLACFGFRSKEESFLLDELQDLSDELLFTSDAGDLGLPGNVVDGLHKLWDEGRIHPEARILTCGPNPMMKAVAQFAAEKNLRCEVSREEHMACGVGLCLVCVCKTKAQDTPEGFRYKRSCLEGPVFKAEEIVWD